MNALRRLPGYENCLTPLCDHRFAVIREPLREYVPDDSLYDETFDWFEYLFGLAHCDLTTTPEELAKLKAGPEGWNIWGPVGRFVWKDDYGGTSIIAMSEWPTGQSLPVHVAAALRAGFSALAVRWTNDTVTSSMDSIPISTR